MKPPVIAMVHGVLRVVIYDKRGNPDRWRLLKKGSNYVTASCSCIEVLAAHTELAELLFTPPKRKARKK